MDLKHNLSFFEKLSNRKVLNAFSGFFVVYKITKIKDGKCYIGITSRFRRRVLEHMKYSFKTNSLIHKNINKYGLKNFTVEVLFLAKNQKDMENKEIFYIKKFKSFNIKYGFNLTTGGGYGKPTLEVIKKKIGNSHKVKVAMYDTGGKFIKEFNSVREAARCTGISDSDIHRCSKKSWTRKGFMFKKFIDIPEKSIKPFVSKVGFNFKIKGRVPVNSVKCILTNKISGLSYKADSIESVAIKAGINKTTIYRIKSSNKNWEISRL